MRSQFTKVCLSVLVASMLFVLLGASAAGQTRRRGNSAAKSADGKPQENAGQTTQQRPTDREPMRLMNPVPEGGTEGADKIWSGVAPVALRANDNPIIRIYMVQGGSTLVEVPDKDRFFAIHPPPPDPQLVVLEDSPTKSSDRFFLIRPGKDFVAPAMIGRKPSGPVPAATVTVQMRSGMTFTIVAYPANDLRMNVHRLVVMYNPVEAANARKANNLATNLGTDDEGNKSSQPSTVRFADGTEGAASGQDKRMNDLRNYALVASQELARFGGVSVGKDAREFPGVGSFGREVAGLRVAAGDVKDLGGNVRMAIVAVQNRKDRALKISQSQPDLVVMVGEGKSTVGRAVKTLYAESNASGGVVPPKGCVVYAIVYEVEDGGNGVKTLRAVVSEEKSADKLVSSEVARR